MNLLCLQVRSLVFFSGGCKAVMVFGLNESWVGIMKAEGI